MSEPEIEANVPLPEGVTIAAPPRLRSKKDEAVSDIGTKEISTVTVGTQTGWQVRKSLVPELYRFVRGLAPDHPYDQLTAAAISAGWVWKLTEDACYHVAPGKVLVRFLVEIGKATGDLELEHFDTITMMVPDEAPSPSLFARANAATTLIYMVFGRLPPLPQQAPAPQPVAEPEYAPRPAPVREAEPEWQQKAPAPVNIKVTRSRDGILELEDPYLVDGRPEEIMPALLDRLQEALDDINDPGLLNILWAKNRQAVEFIKDFGQENGRAAELSQLFRTRANQLNRS